MSRYVLSILSLVLWLGACAPDNREADLSAAAPAAVAPAATNSAAAQPSSEHAHHHDATPGAKLERPPGGGNWPTDAALRRGMDTIHAALAAALPAYENGEFGATQANALASTVTGQVQFLLANCKLAPAADAQLHLVIGQMMSAAEAMVGDAASDEGVPRLHAAVRLYGNYFEHPGLHEHTGAPHHADGEPAPAGPIDDKPAR